MRTKILYEDEDIIVIHKPAGFATQTSHIGQQDVVSEIKNYLAEKMKKQPYIGLINRLDQPVEGIVLLAKNEMAAKELSEQIQKNQMKKSYYAAIQGKPQRKEGTLVDYLRKNTKTNLSKVISLAEGQRPSREEKRAELTYQCIGTVENSLEIGMNCVKYTMSLMDIQLKTGRHHQIRVQMSHAGMPLLGDSKYGNKESIQLSQTLRLRNVALCAYRLLFQHPVTKEEMNIVIEPENQLLHITL